MAFIELKVRTALIAHGFGPDNEEITERVSEGPFMRKLIAVSRIQSVSEQYILVNALDGRQMYWEYEESMDEVVRRLRAAGLVV